MFQRVNILYQSTSSTTKLIVSYSHCRFCISQSNVISNVASRHLIPNTIFWLQNFQIYMSCHHLFTHTTPTSRTVGFLSQIFSIRRMSRSPVICGRRVVCDKNIYYDITFSLDYPVTVLRKIRRVCLLKSNMSSGHLASR